MSEACPECGKVFKRPNKIAEHIAAIPALCDQTTRHWRRKHGIERVALHPQEVKIRPAPDPLNDWSFWQMQLAGDDPSDMFGPHWGFFSLQEWIAPPPPERKKITVCSPVAIWKDENDWQCVIIRSWGKAHLSGVMNVHDIFAKCCRDAVDYETYLAGVREHELSND